jgi:hypothetical protein
MPVFCACTFIGSSADVMAALKFALLKGKLVQILLEETKATL